MKKEQARKYTAKISICYYLITWHKEEDWENDKRHDDNTKCSFHPNNMHRHKVFAFHKRLLDDHLNRRNQLSEQHHAHSEKHRASIACAVLFSEHSGNAHKDKSAHRHTDGNPTIGKHFSMEEKPLLYLI